MTKALHCPTNSFNQICLSYHSCSNVSFSSECFLHLEGPQYPCGGAQYIMYLQCCHSDSVWHTVFHWNEYLRHFAKVTWCHSNTFIMVICAWLIKALWPIQTCSDILVSVDSLVQHYNYITHTVSGLQADKTSTRTHLCNTTEWLLLIYSSDILLCICRSVT